MCDPAGIKIILNEITNLKTTLEYFGEILARTEKLEASNVDLTAENKALKDRLEQYERQILSLRLERTP